MPNFPYIDGAGVTRYRDVIGSGTQVDPDIATVRDTEVSSTLTTINGKFPTLGQKAQSGSISVVPATGSSIITTGAAFTPYISMGANFSAVIKASAGTLHSIGCVNVNSATRYIQFFNKATVPVAGTDIPVLSFPVYGNGGFTALDTTFFGLAGHSFTTGISFGFSTTPFTYTAGAAADVGLMVNYQ